MISRALWLNGTVGAGKTTVGTAASAILARAGEPTAFVDTDAIAIVWPRPDDDPFNTRLVAANLASLVANFSAAGARSLVVAGVVESVDELELAERAIGVPVKLVRITLPTPEIGRRLAGRHGELDPGGLRWHVERAPVLAAILDASDLSMVEVPNTGDPDTTARAVLAVAGWDVPAG